MFMGVFEARKNKLPFAADLIYMSVSNSKSTDIRIGPGPGPGMILIKMMRWTSWTTAALVLTSNSHSEGF